MTEPTLNDVLSCLSYTTLPGPFHSKEILRDGVPVFCGRAREVWAWLRKTGQL